MSKKLRIGVLGTGHLGTIHIKCLQNLPGIYDLVGFHDPSDAASQKIVSEFGLKSFSSPEELIEAVDVVDIVSPTITHCDLIRLGLNAGKHVFVEKPAAETAEQVEELLELERTSGMKVQVGHVERFNPAFVAVKKYKLRPMFVEGHRLAQFNPRGTDVSVVHDLMIHDIDILVTLIPHEVEAVHASGVGVVSENPDICNARVEFSNGAVANLTASRISLKNMRKIRLFQPDTYISVDFLEKRTEIVRLFDEKPPEEATAFEIEMKGSSKWIAADFPEVIPHNAIEEELKSFHQAIVQDEKPEVSLHDAGRSLQLVQKILDAIEASKSKAIL